MIANPNQSRFYGDGRNDRMPAFHPQAHDSSANLLTDRELESAHRLAATGVVSAEVNHACCRAPWREPTSLLVHQSAIVILLNGGTPKIGGASDNLVTARKRLYNRAIRQIPSHPLDEINLPYD